MQEHIRDALESIREELSEADYSTTVSSAQIGSIVIAARQMTSLIERLYERIVDLERVQNERAEEKMSAPRYLTQRQYGEWCIIDTQTGIDVTIAIGCPVGRGGTSAGREYAERITRELNATPALLEMLETLCDGLEWNIDNTVLMNESDSEALASARAVIADYRAGKQATS